MPVPKFPLEFPLHFPKCPNCGGEGVMSLVKQELVLSGRFIQKELEVLMDQKGAAVIDPTLIQNQATMSVIVGSFDVCASCGTEWAVRLDRTEQPNPQSSLVLPQSGPAPRRGPSPGGAWPVR